MVNTHTHTRKHTGLEGLSDLVGWLHLFPITLEQVWTLASVHTQTQTESRPGETAHVEDLLQQQIQNLLWAFLNGLVAPHLLYIFCPALFFLPAISSFFHVHSLSLFLFFFLLCILSFSRHASYLSVLLFLRGLIRSISLSSVWVHSFHLAPVSSQWYHYLTACWEFVL